LAQFLQYSGLGSQSVHAGGKTVCAVEVHRAFAGYPAVESVVVRDDGIPGTQCFHQGGVGATNLMAVYDLVLLDDTNPRALLFQLESLEKHFKKLPRHRVNGLPDAGERILIDCLNRVRLLDPHELSFMGDRLSETATAEIIDFGSRRFT